MYTILGWDEGAGFSGKKRNETTTTNQPLNRLGAPFQFVRFALGARSKWRFYDCVGRAHVPGRGLCARVWPFLPGENDEQTPAGAYPVRWLIQRCKICIYDPVRSPKITKFHRRFSWFWIILHSPPWSRLTPLDTAWTFQKNRKGPLARRGIMARSFLSYLRKFPEPVRGDKGFRAVFWRMDEWADA